MPSLGLNLGDATLINTKVGNWAEWPGCPQCQERREAQCSVCLARGTDFRLADFEEPDDLERGDTEEGDRDTDVLLLCSTCDEPFTPTFYRRCGECEFDWGDGIEEPEIVREELNNRVVIVIVGVVLLLVGLLAFFTVVLRD
ncbi:MAG: hypothetical protein H8E66_26750 [Planctomycetes bacterium]|nr:hypothetical protein [Planctomycetota bacterium]